MTDPYLPAGTEEGENRKTSNIQVDKHSIEWTEAHSVKREVYTRGETEVVKYI